MIVNLVGVVIRGTNSGHNRYGLTKDGKGECLHWDPYAAQGYFKTLTLEKEGQPKRISP